MRHAFSIEDAKTMSFANLNKDYRDHSLEKLLIDAGYHGVKPYVAALLQQDGSNIYYADWYFTGFTYRDEVFCIVLNHKGNIYRLYLVNRSSTSQELTYDQKLQYGKITEGMKNVITFSGKGVCKLCEIEIAHADFIDKCKIENQEKYAKFIARVREELPEIKIDFKENKGSIETNFFEYGFYFDGANINESIKYNEYRHLINGVSDKIRKFQLLSDNGFNKIPS